jgi:hypothetical protein
VSLHGRGGIMGVVEAGNKVKYRALVESSSRPTTKLKYSANQRVMRVRGSPRKVRSKNGGAGKGWLMTRRVEDSALKK